MIKGKAPRPSLLLIAGPTASGKSGLAVRAAKALAQQGRDAVIINADASQVYDDLHIISARPSAAEMEDIPHRLFGYRDGTAACSAADWAKDARREIETALDAGIRPILVGGTGLYISTLLDGIAPIPDIDPAIRAAVRDLPINVAYAQLQELDPAMASRLNANDKTRIQRALEVVMDTKQSISEWRSKRTGGISGLLDLNPLILLLEREWLYRRCDKRFAEMIAGGGIQEVEQLVARGLPDDLPIMRAIGVKEIRGYLSGALSYDEMIAAGQMATRRYAKRQYTWMRNQPPVHWPRIADDPAQWDLKTMLASWLAADHLT